MKQLEQLQQRLNYTFDDVSLLKLALTHRSASSDNYERLEYLGDSVLGFVIAEALYAAYPDWQEGRLSQVRSNIVRREGLLTVAETLQLEGCVLLGASELSSGGQSRPSILADVVEAIIGAVYLDSNFTLVRDLILRLFADLLSTASEQVVVKDAKSRLQEWTQQAQHLSLPEYTVIKITGKAHEQEFNVRCHIPGRDGETVAKGESRRKAEQAAALLYLQQLGEDNA